MKVDIKKDVKHGDTKYEKGQTVNLTENLAQDMIDKGFAEEHDDTPELEDLEDDVEEIEPTTEENNATYEKDTSNNNGGEFVAEVKPGGLSEGEHTGTIINIKEKDVDVGKDDPATYLDIVIDVPDENTQVSPGYNYYISQNSELGKLLKRFGQSLDVGKNIDIGKVLIEKPVKFYVQKNEEGYSEVKKDTLKPVTEGGQ